MKITFKKEVTAEVAFLQVSAGARYWEDATVNGVSDEDGSLIPFRNGDYWEPRIDVNTGIVQHWPQGTTADIHYKVCDDGKYTLQAEDGTTIVTKEGYVPDIMCPKEEGYGDYIIMSIDETGLIQNWEPNFDDFYDED